MKFTSIQLIFLFIPCFIGSLVAPGLANGSTNQIQNAIDAIYKKQVANLEKINELIEETTRSSQSSEGKKSELLRNIDRYKEYKLRVEFTRRLSHQVDSYYQGQPMTPFLIERLGAIADNERKEPQPDTNIILFAISCKDVLIAKPNYNLKPIELLEKFLNYTSISKVRTSSRFFKEQDYSNAKETYEANKTSPTNVGLIVEKKINENKIKSLQQYELEIEPPDEKPLQVEPLPPNETSFMNQESFKKLFQKK